MKLVLKILLIATLFLGQLSFASEVKFIFVTDTNINPKNAYKLRETIKEFNSYKDVDFVVFGGNNLQKANFENLNYFVYLLRRLHKKTYVLLGNNDVSSNDSLDKKYYLKRIRSGIFNHSKQPNYVFKKKGNVFVVMDGSKQYFKSSNGYYSKKELVWLEKTLKKYKKENVVILQHFPVLDSGDKWLSTFKVEEYKEILQNYKNVKVIVSGHYDTNVEQKEDGVYHIITENYSKKGAYKIIELDLDNDFVATYLVK